MLTTKTNSKLSLNWPAFGRQPALDFLSASLNSGHLSQAYILAGPAGWGKTTVAYYLARNILVNSRYLGGADTDVDLELETAAGRPDLNKLILTGDCHIISRLAGKKNIAIEQIRDFIRILEMSSLSNSFKIGIIKEAETLSEAAANALLKLLEEPPAKVVLILITNNLETMIPTIVSRSQVLNFSAAAANDLHDYLRRDYAASPSVAKNLAHLAAGRPALAVKFLEDQLFYDDYLERVEAWFNFWPTVVTPELSWLNNLLRPLSTETTEADLALKTLDIWQSLFRDLYLLTLGEPELIRHMIVRDKLMALSADLTAPEYLRLTQILAEGRSYLRANVNPLAVLETMAINLT